MLAILGALGVMLAGLALPDPSDPDDEDDRDRPPEDDTPRGEEGLGDLLDDPEEMDDTGAADEEADEYSDKNSDEDADIIATLLGDPPPPPPGWDTAPELEPEPEPEPELGPGESSETGGNAGDGNTGTPGNDLLEGDDGDDLIVDLLGDDTLEGGAGDDTLRAADPAEARSDGRDHLHGGDGDDLIDLGAMDFVTGGAGADLFTMPAGLGIGEQAEIVDFDPAEDSLVLVWDDADGGPPPELSFGRIEGAAHMVQVMVDGVVVAHVAGAATLSTEDIALVPASTL